MKSISTCIVLILGLSIFLPSCTIEKRLYNKGFHTSIHGKRSVKTDRTNQTPEENNLASENTEVKAENEVSNYENSPSTFDLTSDFVEPISTSETTFNLEEFPAALSVESEVHANPAVSDSKMEKIEKKLQKKIKKSGAEGESKESNPALVAGIILLILGLILLLLFGLFSILLIVLGLIFLIVGAAKSGSKSEEPKTLQDVIYLKNGSIIRGTIIEQVPNVSIKIQTKDGNVFVYKMEEVEKMTKEPSK